MSNFGCNGCQEEILPQKARIHCQTCPHYDSCTNCYVIGQVSGSHTPQHPIMVYRLSGQQPPPVPGIVPDTEGGIPRGAQAPSPEPPAWDRLFNSDHSATPLLCFVIEEFFIRLDPSGTGYLIPEAYASFIDAQGQPIQYNIWKNAYTKAPNNKSSAADQALIQVFDMFAVEYILRDRPGAQRQPQMSMSAHRFMGNMRPPPPQMPLITLKGFITAVTFDTYTNPDGWIYLNRALQFYQLPIWKERGDIPKALVPDISPEEKQRMQNFDRQLDMMQIQTGARVANELLTGVRMYRY